jgi:transcriptional regulator with XRE-family HTH domain
MKFMSEERQEQPFKSLGERLKTLRQKLQESVADVSGAVEIDEKHLTRIEQGSERPSEDILLLLISHFGMNDDEAAGLWQLAGYEPPQLHDHNHHHHDMADDLKSDRNLVLVMAVDPRVIYSDGAHVHATKSGVVLNFSQSTGTAKPMTTARIGMSREQAYDVLRALQETLLKSEPRQLPPSTKAKDKSNGDKSTEK